jgi:hypothetical protein
MRIGFILLLAIISFNHPAWGQGKARPAELGKPSLEWWSDKTTIKDTTAEAIILFDYGKCATGPYTGTKYVHQRRIKILKKAALDEWGDLSFLLGGVRVADFECTVYNLENSHIVTSVVDKKDFLKTEVVKSVKVSSVAIPNVREGSVIEYSYTLKSYSFSVPTWTFQYSIPVVWSEYEVDFGPNIIGVTATVNGIYDLTSLVKTKKRARKYIMTDLPAFIKEPSMPSQRYFRSSVEFDPSFGDEFEEEYRKDILLKEGITRDSAKMDTRIAAAINFKITQLAELKGDLVIRKSGYDAIKSRREIKEVGNEEYLKKELSEKNWTILKQELVSDTDTTKELILKYELLIQDQIQMTDSLLYVNPYLVLNEESNPLKLERRMYPLDLGSRSVHITTTVIEIPTGYKLDELPKSIAMELPGKDAVFSINSSSIGNSVYITSLFKTNKILFSAVEYSALRDFFGRMVSKKSEFIVFRKVK